MLKNRLNLFLQQLHFKSFWEGTCFQAFYLNLLHDLRVILYSPPPIVMHISLASYVIQIVHPPLKTLDPPLQIMESGIWGGIDSIIRNTYSKYYCKSPYNLHTFLILILTCLEPFKSTFCVQRIAECLQMGQWHAYHVHCSYSEIFTNYFFYDIDRQLAANESWKTREAVFIAHKIATA